MTSAFILYRLLSFSISTVVFDLKHVFFSREILFKTVHYWTAILPGRGYVILKADEFFIFESCNGAQEVEDRATFNSGMDFGSGSTANAIPGSEPPTSSNTQRLSRA